MFPDSSGIVGGIGAVGGVVYPLAFSTTHLPNLHTGYAVVDATMVPILVLCAWVFQPAVTERATTGGWLADEPDGGSVVSGDD